MHFPFDFMRRIPTQKRSRTTVDLILEAAAQILEKDDLSEIETNGVAERAGFSIGTFYSYFADKGALLRTMALHELARRETSFEDTLNQNPGIDGEAAARALVRLAMAPFGGRGRVRRRLIALVGSDPAVQKALYDAIERMTDRLLSISAGQKRCGDAARFLLLRSAMGSIRAAALHRPDLLDSREFEDELVGIICGLLRGGEPPID